MIVYYYAEDISAAVIVTGRAVPNFWYSDTSNIQLFEQIGIHNAGKFIDFIMNFQNFIMVYAPE